MHMDEPIAGNDVNAAESTGFRANTVLGRRVPSSLKSSSCCDIFMTRIFPGGKKIHKMRRSDLLSLRFSYVFKYLDFQKSLTFQEMTFVLTDFRQYLFYLL